MQQKNEVNQQNSLFSDENLRNNFLQNFPSNCCTCNFSMTETERLQRELHNAHKEFDGDIFGRLKAIKYPLLSREMRAFPLDREICLENIWKRENLNF